MLIHRVQLTPSHLTASMGREVLDMHVFTYDTFFIYLFLLSFLLTMAPSKGHTVTRFSSQSLSSSFNAAKFKLHGKSQITLL